MKYNSLETFQNHPAYKYAKDVVNKDIVANVDITMTCEKFKKDVDAKDDCDYYFDYNMVNKITAISKYVIMPKGPKAGLPIGDCLAGFQWFFLINALCWKEKNNHAKRRYEKSVLLIGRKNGEQDCPPIWWHLGMYRTKSVNILFWQCFSFMIN